MHVEVAEIANVMNSNQNVDVDVLLLRTQLVGNLQTLIDHFPEFLDQVISISHCILKQKESLSTFFHLLRKPN